ncbi:MAG: SpoIIIAH-like family protein, partial [Clostridia bacterium]
VLVAAAVLNVVLLKNKDNANEEVTSTASFFTTYKNNRESTRDYEIAQLNDIIKLEGDEYAKARADAIAQKQKIVSSMETELLLEVLLKAQGFEDAVVSVGASSNNINVIVKAKELDRTATAKIYSIITREVATDTDYIKIIKI